MAKKKPSAGRITKLLSNPGTRAALADRYLTPGQLQQRQLNKRLATPIVDGSSVTNRDLAGQRRSMLDVKYGPSRDVLNADLGASKQLQTDTTGWYNDFLRELANHQQNVQANNTAANTALSTLTGQVGKTALAPGASVQNQTDAQNASVVRQALTGGFGAMIAGQGRNADDYASLTAHVVAPGQKLQAQARAANETKKVREKQARLALREGEDGSQYDASTIADESKTVLAKKVLGLNEDKAKVSATETAGAGGRKYGYTAAEWLALSPSQRTSIVKANKAKTSGPDLGKVTPSGYTEAELRAMPTAKRVKIMAAAKGSKTAAGKDEFGNTKDARRRNSNAWDSALSFLRMSPSIAKSQSAITVLQQNVPNLPYDVAAAAVYWATHTGTLNEEQWRQMRRLGVPVSTDKRK